MEDLQLQVGFGEADIRDLKRVFRELFDSVGRLNRDMLGQLRKDRKANPHVKRLVKYLDVGIAARKQHA